MTNVGTLMTREVLTLSIEDGLARAKALFSEWPFRHLPVVDGRRVVGMISQRDILRHSGSDLDPMRALRGDGQRLRETFVAAVMTPEPATVTMAATVGDAARAMLDGGFGCVPVVDPAGEIVGLVTETDLLRHLVSTELTADQGRSPSAARPLRES
ncbi:MAG: CBS domain-containing protein [Sandaracinus sp.]|nr:CBS domain-containing protein [Sandaracinus sp.]|tara:strand:- start:357 stop:824 length:468 start_codon:yes stop_codon:yes gene_type:complete